MFVTAGVKACLAGAVGLEAGVGGVLLPQQRHGELKWMTILGPLFQGHCSRAAGGAPGGEDQVPAPLCQAATELGSP